MPRSSAANYELFDETGAVCTDKTLSVGKFIRFSLPAAGKYDWVKIIGIERICDHRSADI